MIKIAITGEMGSGKSYCSKIFEQLGVPVFNADNIARNEINTNNNLKKELISQYGDIYKDGVLVPKLLSNIVFVDGGEEKLETLNKIIYPYIVEQYQKFCQENVHAFYTIIENALLYETNMQELVDKTIYVSTDLNLRIKRTFERSGLTTEEYHSRMKSQVDSALKQKLANFIISNNENDNVKSQILYIHAKITIKAMILKSQNQIKNGWKGLDYFIDFNT